MAGMVPFIQKLIRDVSRVISSLINTNTLSMYTSERRVTMATIGFFPSPVMIVTEGKT
jgi:hypothetical protein